MLKHIKTCSKPLIFESHQFLRKRSLIKTLFLVIIFRKFKIILNQKIDTNLEIKGIN